MDLNRDGLPDVLLYDNMATYLLSQQRAGFALWRGTRVHFIGLHPLHARHYQARRPARRRQREGAGGGCLAATITALSPARPRLGTDVDFIVPVRFPSAIPKCRWWTSTTTGRWTSWPRITGDSTFAMVLSHAGTGSATVTKSRPTAGHERQLCQRLAVRRPERRPDALLGAHRHG